MTTSILVSSPYQPFMLPNKLGVVFNGYIYRGKKDTDPLIASNQIQIYLVNEDGSRVKVSQPIKTNAGGYPVYNGNPARFVTDEAGSLLVQNSNREQVWYCPSVSKFDPESFINDLGSNDGYKYIGGFDKASSLASGVIMAKNFGVTSGVDNAPLLQEIQNLSESLRVPIDFSGIDVVSFSGSILIGDFFSWKSSGRFDTTISPITKTRNAMTPSKSGVFAWFMPKDEKVSINHAMLQDIGFDGGYNGSPSTPLDRLIRAFCWHADTGATHTDITALRVHARNCPHEFWEGYTTGGGKIKGIRALFCSGDVSDPKTSAEGCNFFKTMNGTIDAPAPYGIYTISDVVSFGNSCRGWRTLNDFKRGTENFTVSACETYDMNDCHHSSDGARLGAYESSNKGFNASGATRATKNFIEIQGEDIDVNGGVYYATSDSSKAGVAGILITDYEYPSLDAGGTKGNQSVNVNVYDFTAHNVNHSAVRALNTKDCTFNNIKAFNCLYAGVSVESTPNKSASVGGGAIITSGNAVGRVTTRGCSSDIKVRFDSGTVITGSPDNEFGTTRIEFDGAMNLLLASNTCRYKGSYDILNSANTLFKLDDFYAGDAIKSTASSMPINVAHAFTLQDNSAGAIMSKEWGANLAFDNNTPLYVSVSAKANSGPGGSVIVQEFSDSGAIVNTRVFPAGLPAGWTRLSLAVTTTNPATKYARIKLAPACTYVGDVSSQGLFDFADFRISHAPC